MRQGLCFKGLKHKMIDYRATFKAPKTTDTSFTFKGLGHTKMKMMSLRTHPHVRSSSEHILRYFRFRQRIFCPSIENVYGILSLSRKEI